MALMLGAGGRLSLSAASQPSLPVRADILRLHNEAVAQLSVSFKTLLSGRKEEQPKKTLSARKTPLEAEAGVLG
jgi:hypothetical protein